MIQIEKKYSIKIYDSTGNNFLQTLNPKILRSTPSFASQINAGYGECRLDLALPFADFGEGSIVDYMNIVEIYEADKNFPLGRLIYRGFISSYEPYLEGSNQGVNIILLGMVSLLKFDFYRDGTSFQIVQTDVDTAQMMRDIIDHFSSIYGTGLITYDGSSLPNVSNSVSYTFNEDLWLDAIQNAFGTVGTGNWYWAVDSEGKFFLKSKPLTPTHVFTIGKDVQSLRILKNSEKVVNAVRVKYSTSSTYDQEDLTSIGEYGRRGRIISDSKITNLATAQARANQEIEENKVNKIQAELIINSQYDIESVKVGDTCSVRNFQKNSTTLDDNMLIVSVSYNSDTISIQLEQVNDNFGLELETFINS